MKAKTREKKFLLVTLVLAASAMSLGASEVNNYMRANSVIDHLGSKSQEDDMLNISRIDSNFAGVVKESDRFVVMRRQSGILPQSTYNLSRMVATAIGSDQISFSDGANTRYSFKELYDFRSKILSSPLIKHLSAAGITVSKNKVTLFLNSKSENKKEDLIRQIKLLNLPEDSYEINWADIRLANSPTTPGPTPPPPPPTTLSLRNGNLRPIASGVGITVGNFGGCSLGLYATRRGVPGFITAGHCYAQPGAWNTYSRLPIYAGRAYVSQYPDSVLGSQIGTVETVPSPVSSCQQGPTFYTNVYCIYTDSIFASFSPGANYYGGLGLYNTNGTNNVTVTPGQILQANPPLGGSATIGSTVTMIGSTTGTNQGRVYSYISSIDSSTFDKPLVIEHVFAVTITAGPGVKGGDSGGGVFVNGNQTFYAAGVISSEGSITDPFGNTTNAAFVSDITAIKSFHGLD